MQNYNNSNKNTANYQNNYKKNNKGLDIPMNIPNNINNAPFQGANKVNTFVVKGNVFYNNNNNEQGYISSNDIYSNLKKDIELSYHSNNDIYSNNFANNNSNKNYNNQNNFQNNDKNNLQNNNNFPQKPSDHKQNYNNNCNNQINNYDYNKNNYEMINSNQNQIKFNNNQNNQYNNFIQNKNEKCLYQSEQIPSQMNNNQLDDNLTKNIQSQQNLKINDSLKNPIFEIINKKKQNIININQQSNNDEINYINQQQNKDNINKYNINENTTEKKKEQINDEFEKKFEANYSEDKQTNFLRDKNISKFEKNKDNKDSKVIDSKTLSLIDVPSLTNIVQNDLNINISKNDERQEKEKEENNNSDEIKNNNINVELNVNNEDNSFSELKSISPKSDFNNNIQSKDNKSFIQVPSLSKIVPNDYNMENNQNNENIGIKNSNFDDIKESENSNNNKLRSININQKDENNGSLSFDFDEIPENATIIKKNNKVTKDNNNDNYNEQNKNNKQNKINELKNENLNFDELIGAISNISNQNNNNEQIKKEESYIQVPSLTNIIKNDYNLNNNNINNNPNIKDEKESIKFTSEINEFNGKDKDNIIQKNNDNKDGTIIPVPGLSIIVQKDYNLKDKKKRNELNEDNINNPAIFSFKNINAMENFDNKINQLNIKDEKEIPNSVKEEVIFNMLNSNIQNNSINNNNYIENSVESKDNKDNKDNKEQKKDINFINNSFCLFRNDSNHLDSIGISLPNNIHNHPFNKIFIPEEIVCSICEDKKFGQSLWKCENCPLIICDGCSKLINYNYNLRDKHMHPLEILEKSFFICCICGKTDNLKKTFIFYCEECNFGICPQCYINKQ